MQKHLTAIGLQAYAIALAAPAVLGGVRTDEAKYLLNIPYPHPPAARAVLELTYGQPWNELFWRLVFATLLVQAVWLAVRLPVRAGRGARMFVAAAWLLSAAVVLQAGSIMMAPLTALSGLALLAAASRPRAPFACFCIALFWLLSLFVAYQAALFLPVVLAVFIRSRQPWPRTLLYAFGPLAALALYTLGNPLSLQSIAGLGGGKAPLAQAAWGYAGLWLLAGSGVASLFGTVGLLRGGRPELAATFLLVSAYIVLSFHAYYAVFLAPLFAAGIAALADAYAEPLKRLDEYVPSLAACIAVTCVAAFALSFRAADRLNPARDTLQALGPHIKAIDKTDVRLLIVGAFGHEWQYYAPPSVREILKYSPAMASPDADVVVCLHACEARLTEGKDRLPGTPVETWVRRAAALHM